MFWICGSDDAVEQRVSFWFPFHQWLGLRTSPAGISACGLIILVCILYSTGGRDFAIPGIDSPNSQFRKYFNQFGEHVTRRVRWK
jgi:hypothetical protein